MPNQKKMPEIINLIKTKYVFDHQTIYFTQNNVEGEKTQNKVRQKQNKTPIEHFLGVHCYCLRQAATIRLPNCPGQPRFGLNNHDLQKNCPTGPVQIESKLVTNLITQATNNKKYQKLWPNWLQTINIIWLFNFTPIFCYSGTSGQTVLWPSLPDRATKKKGNCPSLAHVLYPPTVSVFFFLHPPCTRQRSV